MADQNNALKVLAPEVRTLARPARGPLLAARGVIQRSAAIQATFVQAKAEGWDAERLAEAIQEPLEEALQSTPGEVRQAAQYLAAEFLQIGDTLLIISRDTGRAMARVTEEDIWQPPAVPRESGGMALPLPRLRPELEGFLYQYEHEQGREAKLLADLAVRTNQTAYLATEGDRRLNVSTRQGRRVIEQEIQSRGTQVLAGTTGLIQAFLDHFVETPQAGMTQALIGIAMARTRTAIPDPVAVNFRFDHAHGQHSALANEWVRELARGVSVEAHRHKSATEVRFAEVSPISLQGATFWVADPSISAALFRVPGVSVLHVLGAQPVGFSVRPAGALVIEPGSVHVEGREVADRWTIAGRFSYQLHLDWSRVVTLQITDCPIQYAPPVEIVPR